MSMVMERFANILRAGLLLVVCLIFLPLAGCIKNLSDAAIPGEYRSAGTWGESSLVISEQGTFQQSLYLIGGGKLKTSGVWRMLDTNEKQNKREISFSPFYSLAQEDMGDHTDSISYDIRAFGISGVWIETDSEAGIRYEKQ